MTRFTHAVKNNATNSPTNSRINEITITIPATENKEMHIIK